VAALWRCLAIGNGLPRLGEEFAQTGGDLPLAILAYQKGNPWLAQQRVYARQFAIFGLHIQLWRWIAIGRSRNHIVIILI
jgi:hypothetical protein